MKIENYGVGARCDEVMRRLLLSDAEGALPEGIRRIILLPIPTARDKVHITGTDRLVAEVFGDVGDGDFVIGYGIPGTDALRARRAGAAVFDAAEDEEFQKENAVLSAEGAVGYILTELGCAPRDLTFGIVGYGRIGAAVARILLFLGAKIRVYTSKNLTRVELGECGIDTVYMPRGADVIPDCRANDVIINTAPTPLGATFEGGVIPSGLRVIELASGDNFPGVRGVEKLMSIPDKMYPRSSGGAYFHAIQRYMREVFV